MLIDCREHLVCVGVEVSKDITPGFPTNWHSSEGNLLLA